MKLAFQIILSIVGIALTAIIILQPSKGEGLGAIGSGGQMFFSKNKALEKLLDKATMWLAIVFGLLLILVELYSKM
ncbi:MAG: preprotein translocase subunit SecG [Bacillota bacterium]